VTLGTVANIASAATNRTPVSRMSRDMANAATASPMRRVVTHQYPARRNAAASGSGNTMVTDAQNPGMARTINPHKALAPAV